MDLRFLLTLVVFLGGMWIYLHSLILDLTVAEPAAPTLFLLGVMHYFVAVYLALALFVFYAFGLAAGNPPSPSSGLVLAENILFKTWPVTIFVLLVSFLGVKIAPERTYDKVLAISEGIALVGLFLLSWHTKTAHWDSTSLKQICWFFGLLPVGAIIYLLVMSVALADVQIRTDKAFYAANDTIVVSVRAGGYIFRPTLTNISCGVLTKDISTDMTLAIPQTQHVGSELVSVSFRAQVLSGKRTRHHSINVAKN